MSSGFQKRLRIFHDITKSNAAEKTIIAQKQANIVSQKILDWLR